MVGTLSTWDWRDLAKVKAVRHWNILHVTSDGTAFDCFLGSLSANSATILHRTPSDRRDLSPGIWLFLGDEGGRLSDEAASHVEVHPPTESSKSCGPRR